MQHDLDRLRSEFAKLNTAWGELSVAWFVLRLIVWSLGAGALVMAALAILLAIGPGR